MTSRPTPTPDQFTNATWEDILPLYESLVNQPLDPADTSGIEAWLADWNNLATAIAEAASVANVDYSCDTTDPAKEAAYLRFSGEIRPRADEQTVELARKLLDDRVYPPRS